SPAATPITVAIAMRAPAGGPAAPAAGEERGTAPAGEAGEGWVRVQVADRGPGLPPGAVARLFAPYTRAVAAQAQGVEGLGLGLAIVRELVRAHGGRVGAGARRGGGACFWFEL